MKYRIIKTWTTFDSFIVEADNLEDAIEKGHDEDYVAEVYWNDPGEMQHMEVIEQLEMSDDIADFAFNDGKVLYSE